jgi:hypothetical protein
MLYIVVLCYTMRCYVLLCYTMAYDLVQIWCFCWDVYHGNPRENSTKWMFYHLVLTNSLPWKDPPIFNG